MENSYLERLAYLVGDSGIDQLKKARVMICGCGGVGSFVAEALARSGVGSITLVDFDRVEASNLNRQLMSDKTVINELKTTVLKSRLNKISDADVKTIDTFIDDSFVISGHYDYVIDCIDVLTSKFALVKKCHEAGIRVISALGSAKRLSPDHIKLTTLDKTRNDPLAKAFRQIVKKQHYRRKIEVVFIDQPPLAVNIVKDGDTHKEKYPLGSAVFAVGSLGLYLAYVVTDRLLKEEKMEFKDFKYERIALSDIEEKYRLLNERLKQAADPKTFMEVFAEITVFRGHITTMISLCSTRYTIDTSNEYYAGEQDYWDEVTPHIEGFENEFAKICLDCPFKDQLAIPATFFKLKENARKCFDEAIIEDLQLENKLTSEYSKLKASARIEFEGEVYNLATIQAKRLSDDRETRRKATAAATAFYEEKAGEFDRIYDELVKVRDRMAKKLGFENYIPLGYLRMNRLDYDQEMVAGYRQAILEKITPLASLIYQRQKERLGLAELKAYDIDYEFKTGNPKPHGNTPELLAAADKMYHEMSEETGQFFEMMVDMKLFDLEAKPNKDMGGYCTDFYDYKVPFIFANFNGTSGDVDVLTHEAGHAFQSYLTSKYNPGLAPECMFPTMESAEIHSMSMEFFAHPWMELFFKEDTLKYIYHHIASALTFLPYGALVDHFQHEVYAHPEMSPKERLACFRRLEKMYIPERDYEGFPILEEGGYFYRQGHIFSSPFYYIDYTLAQVCALQFFDRMLKHDPKAWSDYIALCKLGGTKTFLELVAAAGLVSPFAEGTIDSIAESMKAELMQIDDTVL